MTDLKKYDLTHFLDGLKELQIMLTDEQLQAFLLYYEMLVAKNKVMNLTAITEYEDVVEKHFLDSLSLVKAVSLSGKKTVLDLGTGAGFPGIPLKIAFPKLNIVLMDSLNKRIGFLDEVIMKLGLKEIHAVHGRAEEMGRRAEYRENFDLCVSRAVANLASLSEYCIPFVKKGGSFISYKSGEIEYELKQADKAITVLGGKLREVTKFQLPNTEMARSLVVIDKVKSTPKAYPRKAGTPSREPIR